MNFLKARSARPDVVGEEILEERPAGDASSPDRFLEREGSARPHQSDVIGEQPQDRRSLRMRGDLVHRVSAEGEPVLVTKAVSLLQEQVGAGVGGQADDLEASGQVGGDVEAVAADGAGGAEHHEAARAADGLGDVLGHGVACGPGAAGTAWGTTGHCSRGARGAARLSWRLTGVRWGDSLAATRRVLLSSAEASCTAS